MLYVKKQEEVAPKPHRYRYFYRGVRLLCDYDAVCGTDQSSVDVCVSASELRRFPVLRDVFPLVPSGLSERLEICGYACGWTLLEALEKILPEKPNMGDEKKRDEDGEQQDGNQ